MKKIILLLLLSTATLSCSAVTIPNVLKHHFYFGLIGGYGSTTWGELVMKGGPQQISTVSTPIAVDEGGDVWGFDLGYQFTEHYALQFQYMKFRDAKITLAPYSDYDISNPNNLTFNSKTDAYSVITKLTLPFPNNIPMRVYSDFGIASVQRSDMFAQTTQRFSPTFGMGLMYILNDHFIFDGSFDYIAGYGKSEVDPIYDYVPFLYAGTLKVSYLF